MKTIEQINKEIEALEKEKQELIKESKSEKIVWFNIPEKNIQITKQVYNNKTYEEILYFLNDGEEVADHNLLQELRNDDKYRELLGLDDFLVFVPNPDKLMRNKGYVAGFGSDSDGAWIVYDGDPSDRSASLGVFLVRKLKEGAQDGK